MLSLQIIIENIPVYWQYTVNYSISVDFGYYQCRQNEMAKKDYECMVCFLRIFFFFWQLSKPKNYIKNNKRRHFEEIENNAHYENSNKFKEFRQFHSCMFFFIRGVSPEYQFFPNLRFVTRSAKTTGKNVKDILL